MRHRRLDGCLLERWLTDLTWSMASQVSGKVVSWVAPWAWEMLTLGVMAEEVVTSVGSWEVASLATWEYGPV